MLDSPKPIVCYTWLPVGSEGTLALIANVYTNTNSVVIRRWLLCVNKAKLEN